MDLSNLIAHSGFTAKLVLFILGNASVFTWAIILSKWKILRHSEKQNKKFIALFWSGKTMEDIMQKIDKYPHASVAHLFQSGIQEIQKLSQQDFLQTEAEKLDSVQKTLFKKISQEGDQLETYLNWLATTASAAPFVGLFGTVWGIMSAFQNIGVTGTAQLSVIAPGIAEALITTAAGIATAIPAVVFHNYFVGKIRKLLSEMENFSSDFLKIIQQNFRQHASHKKGSGL